MKKTYRLPAILLAAVLLFASVPFILFSGAGRASAEPGDGGALDASKPGDSAAVSIPAQEFFNSACGIDLTEGEKQFFGNRGTVFRYSSAIPSDNLVCTRLENALKVEAKVYSYVSASGIAVKWIPVSARIGEKTAEFKNELYAVEFTGLEGGRTYEIEVGYKTTIVIPQGNLKDAVNAGYAVGAKAAGKLNDYERALAEYKRRSEEYSALYSAYLSAKAKYDAYLNEKAEYDRQKAAYDEYISKKLAYESAMEKYAAYLTAAEAYRQAYAQYETDLAAFREQYTVYIVNAAQLRAAKNTLKVIEAVYASDEKGNHMFSTLMGPTVDTVMKNKGTLEREGGVDPKDVQGAGDATKALRALLPTYKSLKTTAEKFAYYAEHYTEIRSNFIKLFKHLNNLCKNPVVREVLAKEGKLERYFQFVAHLYVLSSCFDDTAVYDPAWTVRGKTLQALLGESSLIPDENNADPTGMTCPADAIDEPVEPTAPTEPEVAKEPVRTWDADLTEPTAPEAVTAPNDPGTLEAYAGTEPSAPLLTADEAALAKEVREGTLAERTPADASVSFETSVTKSVAYAGAVTVRFFDDDHKTLLYSDTLLKGGDAHYGGKTPGKAPDPKYTYSFTGFYDENGNTVSLSGVDRDVDLFARYAATPIEYTVSFEVRGAVTKQTCTYGDMPAAPDYPDAYVGEDGVNYRFTGFEPELTVVTGNASYKAVYVAVPPDNYIVVFNDNGVKTTLTVVAGSIPEAPEARGRWTDEVNVYTFSGWTPEIEAASADAEYTAVYTSRPIVPDAEGEGGARVVRSPGGATVLTDGSAHSFDVSGVFADAAAAGEELTFSTGRVTVTFPKDSVAACKTAQSVRIYDFEDADGALFLSLTDADGGDLLARSPAIRIGLSTAPGEDWVLNYESESGAHENVSFSGEGGGILLEARGSGKYYVIRPYTVTVTGGKAFADPSRAVAGTKVTVTPTAADSPAIESLRLTVDGEENVRTVLGSVFSMPEGNVTVEPVFASPIVSPRFTVRFLDGDGAVILEKQYDYGEALVLPEKTPEKKSDDPGYVYTFTGWTPVVLDRVVADAEYSPVFKQVKNADYQSPYDSNRFFTKVILLQVLPVFVLLVLLVSGPIVYRAYKKKRQKNK